MMKHLLAAALIIATFSIFFLTQDLDTPISPAQVEASTLTFNAANQFSSTQEASGWSYLDSANSYLVFNSNNNTWEGTGLCMLWSSGGHPCDAGGIVRRWTAQISGTAVITGQVYDTDAGGGDGVIVSIKHNNNTLWQQSITNGDTTGFTYDLNVAINAGDQIDFVINKNTNNFWDSTYFNPTITLNNSYVEPGPEVIPVTAQNERYLTWNEWTFGINTESLATFKQRIDAVKNAGFNTVRFQIYWPALETKANTYNWTKFDQRLDYIVSKGLKVAISFNAMLVKDANIISNPLLMTTSDGVIFQANPILGKSHSILSFSSDTAVNKLNSVYSSIVTHYKKRYGSGAVLFYQVTFSPYAETEYWPSALLDYSSSAKTRFQSWLQQKYVNVENMNSALNTNFGSFSAVVPPNNHDGNFGLAWYVFRSEMLKRVIDQLAVTTKTIDPNAKFGIQMGSVWDSAAPLRGTILFNRLAQNVDWVTVDNIATYNHRFSSELLRGALGGKVLGNEIDNPNHASDAAYIQLGKESYNRGLRFISVANWLQSDLSSHSSVISNLVPYIQYGAPVIIPDDSMTINALDLLRNGPEIYINQYDILSEYGLKKINVQMVDDISF